MRQRIALLAARPESWLALLLAWTLLSALRSWNTPWARAAGTEALHWGAGVLLMLTLGRGLRRTADGARALTVLLGGLVVAVVFEGRHADGLLTGPYSDHQLCASALLALLPISLALSLTATTPAWRWGAQTVAVAAALCLALTQTRSAWAGAGVAALVFSAFWLRRPLHTPRVARRRAWVVPTLLAVGVAGAGALLIAGTDLSAPLVARAQTLRSAQSVGQDPNWRARVRTWRGAAAMAAAHPVLGWGLGRYPGAQWMWTHTGRPLGATERPSLSEEAHDFYLQTLVETGPVGLALYLAALAAFAARCVLALRAHGPRPYGPRQALLVAALSLIAGQSVDAFASPSWQFPEVSLLFWAALGLGLAATCPRQAAETTLDFPRPVRRFLRFAAAGVSALLLAAFVLPVGLLSPVEAYTDNASGAAFGSLTLTPQTAMPSASAGTDAFTLTLKFSDSAGSHTVDVTTDPTAVYTVVTAGLSSKFSDPTHPNVLQLNSKDASTTGKHISVNGLVMFNSVSHQTGDAITLYP